MPRTIALLVLLSLVVVVSAAEEKKDAKKSTGMALDELLRGRVTSLKGDVIEIYYDFTNPKEMDDWVAIKPFRVDGKLEMKHESRGAKIDGSGCMVHQIAFCDEVAIEFDCTPWYEKDFGGIVAEDGQSDHFVLYSVNDLYFQKFDGGAKPGHMICRFGIIDPSEPADAKAFRYVARGMVPKIEKFKKIRLVAKKEGKSDEFMIGDTVYKGKEPGREMLDLLVGAYVAKSGCLVDNVTVRGKISPRWLKKAGADLRLKEPPKPLKVSPIDLEARAKIEAFARGEAPPADVIEVVDDAEVSEEVREEAADALIATENPKLVPKVVSLLYSNDEITRKLGNRLIKALTGKSFGYNATADEEKRSAAIQKILKHIQKYEKKYQ